MGRNDEQDQLVPMEVAGELGGGKACWQPVLRTRWWSRMTGLLLWSCGRGESGQLGVGNRVNWGTLVRAGAEEVFRQ